MSQFSNIFLPHKKPGTGGAPALSCIVSLYNGLALTKAMLSSLLETLPKRYPFEIILVDDGSTDGTREWLATLTDPRFRVLLNDSNLGFAAANNRGAALAKGEFLALLNNDLVLLPGWLQPMVKTLRNPSLYAGIVGNVQLRTSDGSIDHVGICATPGGKLAHVRELPKVIKGTKQVFAVTAACCLLRRQDFEKVGGFDEAYVNGGEDVDLALKLRALGRPVGPPRFGTKRTAACCINAGERKSKRPPPRPGLWNFPTLANLPSNASPPGPT